MTDARKELNNVKADKEVARSLREWFEEAIELAVWTEATHNKRLPYQRISRDPDGTLWYVGPEGEFQFEITVYP